MNKRLLKSSLLLMALGLAFVSYNDNISGQDVPDGYVPGEYHYSLCVPNDASSPPCVSLLPIFSLLSDIANIDSATTHTATDSGFIYSFFIILIASFVPTDSFIRG